MKQTKIRLTSNFDQLLEHEIEAIWQIYASAFEQSSPQKKSHLISEINRAGTIHSLIAYDDEQAIGFKLGYPKGQYEFYSWIEGVKPSHQHLGIATALMTHQHEWANNEGFKFITTETENKFKTMLVLNLKMGFDIQGIYQSSAGNLRIMLKKILK